MAARLCFVIRLVACLLLIGGLPVACRKSIEDQRQAFLSVTGGSKYTADGQRWEILWDQQRECREAVADQRPAACSIRGHAKPLGNHRDHEPVDTYTMDKLPTPEAFWKRHVNFQDGFRVAYFPGMGKTHPAFENWNSDRCRRVALL